MVIQDWSSRARRVALGSAAAALVLLTGCVAVPMDAYDPGAPVVYSDAPYYGSTYYGGPAYYGAPVYQQPYWGPAVSLGIYGGFGGDRGHWRGPPGRGHGHWQRPPGAGGGQWNRPPGAGGGSWHRPPPGAGGGHGPRPPGAGGGHVPRPPAAGSRWQPGIENGSLGGSRGGGGVRGGRDMP